MQLGKARILKLRSRAGASDFAGGARFGVRQLAGRALGRSSRRGRASSLRESGSKLCSLHEFCPC